MSQGVESYVAIPANASPGQPVRQLKFWVAQTSADGAVPNSALTPVFVQVVAMCDPANGNPVALMTKDQGDEIIALLKKLVSP